jgi:WD40 repeat protein
MQLKNICFVLFLLFSSFTSSRQPDFTINCSGGVSDLCALKDRVFIATNKGLVNILNLKTRKVEKQMKLPPVRDFTGESIPPAIYTVDVLSGTQKVLIASQGEKGFTNVYSFEGGSLKLIINSAKTKMSIREARIVDAETLLFALLSNELVLYNLGEKKEVYRKQISLSSFSDMQMDESRSKVVVADESGIIHLIEISTGRILKEFRGMNYDRIFKLDFKNHRIICGSQDRRISVNYETYGKNYFMEYDWPVYVVGLSPDGGLGSFSMAENMGVIVFDLDTHEHLLKLDTQESSISCILFLNNNEIIAASEDSKLFYWTLF